MIKILVSLSCLLCWGMAFPQELVITNARIIVGTGPTIDRGSVVIADGRIASIVSGETNATGEQIDAQGMTVMPGFIDTHRHDLFDLLTSESAIAAAMESETPRNLETLLAEGFTTIMVPSFFLSPALEIRQRLSDGELRGPRLLTTGPGFTAPGDHPAQSVCRGDSYCGEYSTRQVAEEASARAAVRAVASAGVDAIKVFYDTQIVPDVHLDQDVMAAVIDETRQLGLPAMVHAETADDLVLVVELGAQRLVHTPNSGLISDGPGARMLREAGIPISTTSSWTSPQFAEANGSDYQRWDEHWTLLQNVRHLWDEGVTVAFGTDSPPNLRPIAEVEALSRVLSPAEIVTSLTSNAAKFLGLADQIGTLEADKIADIVIVDGNPLENITDVANVQVVIQGGRIVVDNR